MLRRHQAEESVKYRRLQEDGPGACRRVRSAGRNTGDSAADRSRIGCRRVRSSLPASILRAVPERDTNSESPLRCSILAVAVPEYTGDTIDIAASARRATSESGSAERRFPRISDSEWLGNRSGITVAAGRVVLHPATVRARPVKRSTVAVRMAIVPLGCLGILNKGVLVVDHPCLWTYAPGKLRAERLEIGAVGKFYEAYRVRGAPDAYCDAVAARAHADPVCGNEVGQMPSGYAYFDF